jgi:cytochrome c biogenesis protein CcdA
MMGAMKRTAVFGLALASLFAGIFFSIPAAQAQENTSVPIHFFGRDDCRFCQNEKAFLEELATREAFTLVYHDISENEQDRTLFYTLTEAKDIPKVTPITLIGYSMFQGFDAPETTGVLMEQALLAAREHPPVSVAEFIVSENGKLAGAGGTCEAGTSTACEASEIGTAMQYTVPFFGVVDLGDFSLLSISFILGFIDGFNPCAIWVLATFLLILLQLGDRKKMIYVAGLFLIAEAVMYMLILNFWYTAWDFVGLDNIVTPLVGLLAIGSGLFFMWRWWKSRNAPPVCDITSVEQQQTLEDKIRALAASPFTIATVFGIIGVAFSVNVIEFACSIGIPQAYSKILELNGLGLLGRQLYILVYMLAYMIDDLVVFGLAFWGFNKIRASYRYSRYATITGGILMLILGILLIYNPNLLVL